MLGERIFYRTSDSYCKASTTVVFSEITALEKAVGTSLKAPVRSGRG